MIYLSTFDCYILTLCINMLKFIDDINMKDIRMIDYSAVATICRREMEEFAQNKDHIGSPLDLTCYCAIASYLLFLVLQLCGDQPSLVKGMAFDPIFDDIEGDDLDEQINHCWVELDSKIIDITATQFGIKNRVHIVSIDDENYQPIIIDANPTSKLFEGWGNQSPFNHMLEPIAKKIYNQITNL